MERPARSLEEFIQLGATADLLIMECVSSAQCAAVGTPMNDVRFVHMSLLSRALRLYRAARTLCATHQPAEAAIILLSLFELRLDVQYIGNDAQHARTWMTHSAEKETPWRVGNKIDHLFKPNARDQAQRAIFAFLSQFKHSSPVAGSLAFGYRGNGTSLSILFEDEPNDPMVTDFCRFVLHAATVQALVIADVSASAIGGTHPRLLEPLGRLRALGVLQDTATEGLAAEMQATASADGRWITPHKLAEQLKSWGNVMPSELLP